MCVSCWISLHAALCTSQVPYFRKCQSWLQTSRHLKVVWEWHTRIMHSFINWQVPNMCNSYEIHVKVMCVQIPRVIHVRPLCSHACSIAYACLICTDMHVSFDSAYNAHMASACPTNCNQLYCLCHTVFTTLTDSCLGAGSRTPCFGCVYDMRR